MLPEIPSLLIPHFITSFMKRKYVKIIISISILLYLLWLLNPSEKEYISYIRNNYPNAYTGKVKSSYQAIDEISKSIDKGNLTYDPLNMITYSYTHHLFFSTGSVIEYSKKYEYLHWYHIGIFGVFFTSNKHYYPCE